MQKTLFVPTLVAVTLSACSGGSSTSCGSFSPCGGSVVGTWHIANVCNSTADAGVSQSDASCSTTTALANLKYTGTFTFQSDGTYTADVAVNGSTTLTYTPGCFTSGLSSCSTMDSLFNNPGMADAGISVSCTSTPSGGCACNETLNAAMSPQSGTYTTSGDTIAMKNGSASTAEQSDYCVQGNTLMIHATSTSGQSSTLVATK